ncbi:MAG: hypothetical protein KAT13_03310 [Methanosarcinales archaeon]|nr:hypothetical protein [Methanosarcinales archaeon]
MSKESRMQLDLREGSIDFWVEKNKLRWNDGLIQILVNIPTEQGNILIVKDSDNKLKFSHVLLGKGRTDVEIDVSDLSINESHHIAATWSISKKEIVLYIDGGEKTAKSNIKY